MCLMEIFSFSHNVNLLFSSKFRILIIIFYFTWFLLREICMFGYNTKIFKHKVKNNSILFSSKLILWEFYSNYAVYGNFI
jgi:hypothetical protein